MAKEELKPIDVSKYTITETGQVLKMNKNKCFLNGGRGSGKTFKLLCETYENKIADLEKKNKVLTQNLEDTEIINAELKDKLNKIERKCKFNFVDLLHDVENESKQEEQLTNAKEIIKQLMKAIPYGSGKLATESYDKAEQFLKDSKQEG